MSVTLDQAPILRRRSAVRPARAAVPGDAGRILIISDAWQPQVNGVVRTYENICHALEAQGCTVRVIGPADFRAVALPSYPEIPLALFPGRRLAALIESFAPDAVHIAVEGPLGWAARGWCLARGVPFSTAFHTNFPAYAAVRAPRGLRGGVEALTIAGLRHFHAPARFIYVATASLEEQLRGWGFANRFVRLSRGIDFTLFHPAMPDRRSPGARGTANGAGPVLLYVGRVAPEKNIETFLALRTPGQKVVVGDGPLLPALRARHPEVIFHGTLRGRALADAYRAADLFVFPSRTDTFGNVVIEALASGLPVAAYDVPGPRDIVAGDARLGAVDADLEAAVARALIAPGTAQERHDLARARFCWNKVAQVFRDHCAELRGPGAVPAG
ncbi:glycosyltransferase family 4 protein [Phaeovulum vinaykumarii]|uniref:Glycosyltransferase involved in cell wall bisynthesis n=1 Tax=Phaeovulum vinaykumarii TaxID=407234 RepID=A0A1N7MFG0_9RHOB|nr:glycosyltransferase family 1 protein [Phaeovulum vinaykumarii]SIS84797.1 Glycosyltransferase involved in cell wall bisynthesis [Phaeovulum vinaykumarii]SOC11946.1 glycosyltransferase involved in cell wall bisynthesis [Phaeovulum vinaykumarii]